MTRTSPLVAAAAAFVAVAVGAVGIYSIQSAASDSERCAGRTEYDNTERFLSADQIQNRYDVGGYYLDADSDEYKRGYRTCWAPGERRIVVWYSLQDGLTTRWDVRDI